MKLNRRDIELLSKNSDLQKEESEKLFNSQIRPNTLEWNFFLKYLLLILGLGFLASGVIFFFAFNWEDLPKWSKLSIPLFLMITTVSIALYLPNNKLGQNILFTFASIMVGAFLAVFGQAYQTGAFAYELFLAWILLVSIWCFVIDFEGAWLLYLLLFHTVISLYINYYQDSFLGVKEYIIQSIFSIVYNLLFYLRSHNFNRNYYVWFRYILFLITICFLTFTLSVLFFDDSNTYLIPMLFVNIAVYYFYYHQSVTKKSLFYIAFILLSSIIIISSGIISLLDHNSFQVFIVLILNMFLITFGIKYLRNLQKSWNE